MDNAKLSAFDAVWSAILQCAGEEFVQQGGRPFTYEVRGAVLRPSTTDRNVSRTNFEQAFERMPLSGPGAINDLQGPSYVYAILIDSRIAAHKSGA